MDAAPVRDLPIGGTRRLFGYAAGPQAPLASTGEYCTGQRETLA